MRSRFPLTRYYNWLIFSIINPCLRKMLVKYAHGRMADVGCGAKPYQNLAADCVSEHIGIDYEGTMHSGDQIDINGTAYNIPVDDGSFDCVLCTDVLEHLEDPSRAISEARRILKTGGVGIYTVPFFWHLHEEPRDFYRYTKFGLKYLFEHNGFEILELHALSGFFVTLCQLAAYYLVRHRSRSKLNPFWWLIPPIVVTVQGVAYLLNTFDRSEEFTIEYLVVVRKIYR